MAAQIWNTNLHNDYHGGTMLSNNSKEPNYRNVRFPASILACAISLGIGSTQASLIEEVTVTAQKRKQSLQDVSIAVNAFNSTLVKDLGINQPKDLDAYTPNLNVKNATGNGNPIFTVRGVGVSAFVGNANPSVGVYFDEIYLPTNMLMTFSTLDIDQVEVVKGPQGTLFGRNTTGGAVTFRSTAPSRETSGYIDVNYGNYDRFIIEAAIGGALTKTLAGRVAVKKENQSEGYFDNRVDGDTVGKTDIVSGRVSLLWEPNEDLDVGLSIHSGTDNGEYYPWDHIGLFDVNAPTADARFPSGQFFGGSGGLGFPLKCPGGDGSGDLDRMQASGLCVDRAGYQDNDGDPFEGEYATNQDKDNESSGAVLKIQRDFEDFSLISVTGYESFKRDAIEEFDSSPNVVAEVSYKSDITAFSQEIRLVSDDSDSLTWILGAFYSHDENETADLYNYDLRFLADLLVDYEQETDATALFGHLEWSFTDEMTLVAGLRYTSEETDYKGGTIVQGNIAATNDFFGFNFPQGQLTFTDDSTDDTAITGKIGLDWRPNENWLIYASINRGFKSGGFSGFWTFAAVELEPYDSETLTSFELGFKSTLLDGSMQLNANAFWYDYEDLQIFALNNQFAFVIENASKVDVSGLEAELKWNPAEGLDLLLGIGYLNEAEITDFETAGFISDFNGNQLPDSPEWNISGTLRYEWSITDSLSVAAMLVASFKDEANHQVDNLAITSEDSYWLTDARITLISNESPWELSIWAKNLADEEYYGESIYIANAGVANRSPGAPRTYGLQFRYSFD